jgi:drug/metabolite transporter (DMT)-like permease
VLKPAGESGSPAATCRHRQGTGTAMNQHTAEFLLVVAALIWGSSYAGMKGAEEAFAPFTIIALRFGIAFLLAALLFHRSLTGITRRTVMAGAVLGFLLSGVIASLLYALPTTPTTTAGFLFATMVVLVPLFRAVFFQKIPGLPLVIGICLAVTGVALLALDGDTFFPGPGSLLCLAGAVCLAFQIIANGEFVKTEDPLPLGILQFGFTALFGLVPAILFDPVPDLPGGSALFSVLYLAIVCTMIAFTLQTIAQKYTTPEHTSLIFTLESVFAALFGFVLLHEVLSARDYAGILLILAGVLIAVLREPGTRRDVVPCGNFPEKTGTGE